MLSNQKDWARLPNERIRALLSDYVQLLQERLSHVLVGVYLYNSIALGAFDDEKSDIDFVTLLKRPLEAEEIAALKEIHLQIEAVHTDAKRMDGSYIFFEHAGQPNDVMQPYPYYASEAFHEKGYYDINAVTWWTIKNRGITLTGVPIAELDFQVPWESVQATMDYNINGYWTKRAQIFTGAVDDYTISDGVLTVCRIMYTLAERDITSKMRAAEYALSQLDPQWHSIIAESRRIRLGSHDAPLYDSQEEKTEAARQFLQAMIQLCKESYLATSV